MSEDRRAIRLEIEVPGTPEEVWRAVATGPGISSWFVPHSVEERVGGAAVSSFGPGPEMQIPGRVVTWEPPEKVVFDGGEGAGGLAFEWTVEAKDGGTCVVRFVNTGFGEGEQWDGEYDSMTDGWRVFLLNLKLHLAHFAGQKATSSLPMGMWEGPRDETWKVLTEALGLPASPAVGDRLATSASDAPLLAGTVVDTAPRRIVLLTDEPAPGTAFIVVEDAGPASGVSIWCYLYGDDAAAAVDRDGPLWQQWLADRGMQPPIEAERDLTDG